MMRTIWSQFDEAFVHWPCFSHRHADPLGVSSLYFKMAERMNCVQNQITINNRVLIQNKVASFIITGGQDNVQGVAGQMLTSSANWVSPFPSFPMSPTAVAGPPRTWRTTSSMSSTANICTKVPASWSTAPWPKLGRLSRTQTASYKSGAADVKAGGGGETTSA